MAERAIQQRPVGVARRAETLGFEAFYVTHHRRVVGLGYALTGSWSTAEDVAQEAFLRTYERWETISAYERPDVWVRTVAANLARSRWRRLGTELRALTRVAGSRESQPDTAPEVLPAETEAFWRAVRSLPRRQAQVVVLHYLEDLSIAEVSAAIGAAEGTVKSTLYRARRQLALQLDEVEDDGA
jgi:RNA polymerase sigma-70 factor, ECF subfamily